MKRPIIFYDLECTGAEKDTNKVRIIEISAKKVDPDTLEEIDSLYFKCNNDDVPIAPDATERHGVKEEDLIGYPTFREVAHKVYDFFVGCDLGGYYSTFYDNPILYMSFMRSGITWNYRELKVYDIFTLYKKYNSGKLGEVYERYTGKKMENAHEADADIRATIAIYREQLKRGETFDEEELFAYRDCLDIAGSFKVRLNKDGVKEAYVDFGKWKGTAIDKVDTSYFKWMCVSEDSFPLDTRVIAKKILKSRGVEVE